MTQFDSRVCFGFSPTMLFPASFEDPLVHLTAIEIGCHYPHYETFETYLPDDRQLREACIRQMRASGKTLHYNTPGVFQQDGPYNPCSDEESFRRQALELMKKQVDFAAEAEAPLMVLTGAPDKGPERRPELLKRYMDYLLQVAEYAQKFGIMIVIEPIERHRFKKILLGPTTECVALILDAQKQGAANVHMMLDIGHLPLMEETLDQMFSAVASCGFAHVHMGNAVLEPTSVFYGHTHPPIGVQGGVFDVPELTEQFVRMFECGYIPRTPGGERARISLEVRPYPGSDEGTSIQLMYEKTRAACDAAAARLGIY
ncbi:MAG: sugar phosphate isomerase/epimerase [Clostridiales bacterium]|nr:sugar phosphate isomerase/epimerase [Clostridiales bacterium]